MATTQANTLQPYHPDEPPVRSLATVHEFDVQDVIAKVVKIQQVMQQVMREGEHYGVIPGATKPSLLKPGAELLCTVFRLDPQYGITERYDGDHLTVGSTCTLYHIPTTMRMGSGMGMGTTKEKKYKWRTAKRQCPKCGAEAIFRSKYPPKDKTLGTEKGWYCFGKQGGCNLEFAANDSAILNQPTGQILNPDLPDLWNTVVKMSNKRALIAAVLNVTAASDIFTQDLEDFPELVKDKDNGAPPPKKTPTRPVAAAPAPNIEAPEMPDDDEEILDDETPPRFSVLDEPAPRPRDEAPFSEWLATLAIPTTPAKLEALWKDCIDPNRWRKWTFDQKQQMISAKDAAKIRLGIK